jgi:hypothetical protein
MITRQVKHVVVFAWALGLVMVAVPRGVAVSPVSTIHSFGTITPDGAVPKGSLTYVAIPIEKLGGEGFEPPTLSV